jgi:hypothetical protein
MRKSIVVLGILAALFLLNNAGARAETGKDPQLDALCLHPAYAADTPVVVLNGNKIQLGRVGLRAKNAYCTGPDVVLPPDYGSGPALLPVPPPPPLP